MRQSDPPKESGTLRRRYLARCSRLGWTPLQARYFERAAKNPDGPAYLWIPGERPE